MPAARTRNSHSSLRCRRSKACAHSQSTEAPCMAGRRYVHGASRTFCKLNKRRRRLGAKLGKSRREHREHKKNPTYLGPIGSEPWSPTEVRSKEPQTSIPRALSSNQGCLNLELRVTGVPSIWARRRPELNCCSELVLPATGIHRSVCRPALDQAIINPCTHAWADRWADACKHR